MYHTLCSFLIYSGSSSREKIVHITVFVSEKTKQAIDAGGVDPEVRRKNISELDCGHFFLDYVWFRVEPDILLTKRVSKLSSDKQRQRLPRSGSWQGRAIRKDGKATKTRARSGRGQNKLIVIIGFSLKCSEVALARAVVGSIARSAAVAAVAPAAVVLP